MMKFVKAILVLASAGLCLTLLFGWFASLHPAFDSFATFRMVFGACLLPVVFALIITRHWLWVSLGAATLLVSTLFTMPHLPGMKRGYAVPQAVSDRPVLKVLQANVLFANDDIQRIANGLLAADADIIVLQEIAGRNEEVLSRLADKYANQVNCRIARFHSVAILVRIPYAANRQTSCIAELGFGRVNVMFGDTQITIGSFHAWWPWPLNQYEQIDLLTEHWKNIDGATIIAGDFNAAPWSHAVARVAQATSTQVPAGAVFSWGPAAGNNTFPELRPLPIDHALHSRHFGLLSRKALPSIGSDHLPVLNTYVLLHEKDQK